jgi:hypothetical protein
LSASLFASYFNSYRLFTKIKLGEQQTKYATSMGLSRLASQTHQNFAIVARNMEKSSGAAQT